MSVPVGLGAVVNLVIGVRAVIGLRTAGVVRVGRGVNVGVTVGMVMNSRVVMVMRPLVHVRGSLRLGSGGVDILWTVVRTLMVNRVALSVYSFYVKIVIIRSVSALLLGSANSVLTLSRSLRYGAMLTVRRISGHLTMNRVTSRTVFNLERWPCAVSIAWPSLGRG